MCVICVYVCMWCMCVCAYVELGKLFACLCSIYSRIQLHTQREVKDKPWETDRFVDVRDTLGKWLEAEIVEVCSICACVCVCVCVFVSVQCMCVFVCKCLMCVEDI